MKTKGQVNKEFLQEIKPEAKERFIAEIANAYGVKPSVIFDEVTSDEAESILDYMREPRRSVAFVLMQVHGFCDNKGTLKQ